MNYNDRPRNLYDETRTLNDKCGFCNYGVAHQLQPPDAKFYYFRDFTPYLSYGSCTNFYDHPRNLYDDVHHFVRNLFEFI